MVTSALNNLSTKTAVAINQIELISSLGFGGQANSIAMKCGYDGFIHNGQLITSPIDYDKNVRGYKRLAYFLNFLNNKIAEESESIDHVILCIQTPNRQGSVDLDVFIRQIYRFIVSSNLPSTDSWQIIKEDRVSLVMAIDQASYWLNHQKQRKINKVLILSIDSFLFPQTINAYLNQPDRAGIPHKPRLLTDDNSDGFIPGEAAGSIIVTRSDKDSQLICSGAGLGEEEATIGTTGILRGIGLSQAIQAATKQAQIDFADCHYRISSASGEEYFFKEIALAQAKLLSRKIEKQPLLLPASHIGEVGATIGTAMLLMAKHHLTSVEQSVNIVCQMSNDDSVRGALILQNKQGE